ncbi:hypothetical protein [Sphingomonas pruni]|uniref:hypothetical protein n=1 Tax=Sphingomonas pruni TaxID=40683 RepID=UPI001C3FB395|nr:hypothetical protein [Sphingomonas pruni]
MMRFLWPIELEALRMTIKEYPASAEAIRSQIGSAQVVAFENTGGGFFSNLAVAENVPPITDKFPLEGGNASVSGVEYGIGLLIWGNEGRLTMIEGYSNAGEPTVHIDFSEVSFEIAPWSST